MEGVGNITIGVQAYTSKIFPRTLVTGRPGIGKSSKEVIALGMAESTRCDSCIGFHVKALTALGTTREEMVDALSMFTYMGGGTAMAYSAKALEARDEFSA